MTKGLKRIWDPLSPLNLFFSPLLRGQDDDPSVSQYRDHQECSRSRGGYSYLIRFAQQRTRLAAHHYHLEKKSLGNPLTIKEVGVRCQQWGKKPQKTKDLYNECLELRNNLSNTSLHLWTQSSLLDTSEICALRPGRKSSTVLERQPEAAGQCWHHRRSITLAAS